MCIRSEEPHGNPECPSDLLLLKLHLGVQSEKGTEDRRAGSKLKPAQPIMCSLPISISDKVDHVALKYPNSPYWVHW